jgi:restriction system protein
MAQTRTASHEAAIRAKEEAAIAAQTALAVEAARKSADRRARAEYLDDRVADAERRTAVLDDRVEQLSTVLARGLRHDPRIDLAALRRELVPPPLDLASIGWPTAPPDWSRYEPEPPAGMGRLVNQARHRARLAAAQQEFERARAAYERTEADRQVRFAAARRAHATALAAARREVEHHNAQVDQFAAELAGREPDAVAELLSMVIERMAVPQDFPRAAEVTCGLRGELAVVRMEMPGRDVVPAGRAVRYVAADDELWEVPRPAGEIAELHRLVIGQVGLLCLRDLFAADPGLGSVALTGYVRDTDMGTGRRRYPTVLEVHAYRETLEHLDLTDVPTSLAALGVPYDLDRTA